MNTKKFNNEERNSFIMKKNFKKIRNLEITLS